MKSIGFIDYYLSEWHANNYPAWIKKASENMGEDFQLKYAWAELDVSPLDGVSTDEWCEKYGAKKCESIDELCQKSDYILILAPSDPHKHPEYAKHALKYKKNTYIDKTFAPDYKNAKIIFDTANEYGTRFFSSSALRFATELDALADSESIITMGGGSNVEEYIIHQVEMAVKLIKEEPLSVRVEIPSAAQTVCSVKFDGGKNATLIHATGGGFMINSTASDGKNTTKTITSDFFGGLIADILRFYKSGEVSFDTEETLKVMKIRDAILSAKSTPEVWVNV